MRIKYYCGCYLTQPSGLSDDDDGTSCEAEGEMDVDVSEEDFLECGYYMPCLKCKNELSKQMGNIERVG